MNLLRDIDHHRAVDTAAIAEFVDETVSRNPVIGLAVGVVHSGKLAYFAGRGVADIDTHRPITEDSAFRVASITKTFSAIAVMQLFEQGVVELDAPANDYLTSYRLAPARAGWRQPTVRHLLTHTAGLSELAHPSGAVRPDFGESTPIGEELDSLSDFYRGELRYHAEPGTRFVYGNHSPATLGQIVEDVSGVPLADYVRHRILEPLGMFDSDLVRSPGVSSRLVSGYEIGSRGVKRVAERDMVTTGAASLFSTPRDMGRYLAALLGGGRNEFGAVLTDETLRSMFEAHYRPDPRIPGMGLAFFRHEVDGRLVVGHQGTHPGFHSQFLIAPDGEIGAMAFTNGAHQADFWLPAFVTGLLRRGLGASEHPRRTRQRPEIWPDVCGWYRLTARLTDVRLRAMMGFGAEVFVKGGRLMFRFLSPVPALAAGFALEAEDAADPYSLRLDLSEHGLDPIKIVFSQDHTGATDRLHLDVMTLTLPKQPDRLNPRRWVTGVVTGVTAATATRMVRSARAHRCR
ncbi:MAG: beta-lactamase family protein [Acidimicrobiia bacterium]|nr:beta-lactamase family protein [Acidimicrobiia bacterium]